MVRLKKVARSVSAAALGGALLLGSGSAGAVPATVAYEGQLTGSNGQPFNGQVNVTASLFTQANGGSPVWGPFTFSGVTVNNGRLSVPLGGAGSPAIDSALIAADNVWLQVAINGTPLSPRFEASSVPYAVQAKNADMLGGVPASSYLQQGDVDISGNTTVDGDLVVGGDVIVNGQPIGPGGGPGFPTGPVLHFGISGGAGAVGSYEYIQYPSPFPANPILLAGIDETVDDSGPSWTRITRNTDTRSAIRLDGAADALHWLAMQPGVYNISGKQVIAGSFTKAGGATTNDTVFFPQLFSQPPVVMLLVDESVDNNGASSVRIINNVSTGGFQLWLDGTADAVHWIAMEPGNYTHGRYQWRAGVFELNNSCTTTCNNIPWPGGPFATTPGVILTINDINNSGASWSRLLRVAKDTLSFRLTGSTSTERVFFVAFENYLQL